MVRVFPVVLRHQPRSLGGTAEVKDMNAVGADECRALPVDLQPRCGEGEEERPLKYASRRGEKLILPTNGTYDEFPLDRESVRLEGLPGGFGRFLETSQR